MIAAQAQIMFETRLPQLGGRWVSAYRAGWCLLALGATGLLAASLLHPTAHPAILALRLLKAAVLISVSAILLHRRARDPVAALLSLAFLSWTITSSFDFASADLLPLLFDRVRFLLFVLALLLFPDGRWRPNATRGVALASAAVFLLGLAEGSGIVPTRLFLPFAIGCVAAAVVALLAKLRTAQTEAARQQLKWVALGLVAGIGLILCARAGAAVSAASPVLQSMPILWEGLFQLGIVVVALGFLVSLLRYRLFDAETAISRSAVFAALTIAVVAVFAGTEATIENVGQSYLGMGAGNISAAMAAAVAAVLLNPLHDRISSWAEQRFQRDLVLLKRDLPELLEDLAAGASPRQLGAAILPRINRAVHATRSALLTPQAKVIAVQGASKSDVQRWSRTALDGGRFVALRDGADDLFPVRVALHCPVSGESGWLVLGPRPDGSLHGKEDLDAIQCVLPAIRRALSWAAAREASRERSDRRWRELRGEVAELRARLNPASSGTASSPAQRRSA